MTHALKSAIITGAGSGIGRAAALDLARRGFAVALVGRTNRTLEAVAVEIQGAGGKAQVIVADVSRPEETERMAHQAMSAFGRIDALINNAGMVASVPLWKITPERWAEVFQANLSSALFASQAVWPMMERPSQGGGRGGIIVNISSMATRDPFPGLGAYAAAKAGLNMLTLVLAREGAAAGIRVIGIAPGSVDTPMFRGLMGDQPIQSLQVMQPEEVGSVIAAAASGALSLASGETLYLHRTPA